jgi:lysozyme
VPGIDVSVHQGDIDWEAIRGAGKRWAMIRSGFGLGADRRFAENWSGARSAGVMRGAYHFFLGARDPRAQAELMADVVNGAGGMRLGDLPPVLDLERGWQTVNGTRHDESGAPMLDPDHVLEASLTFLEEIQKRLRRRPMIYTGEYFHWSASQARPELARRFGKYPLWLGIAGQTAQCVRLPTGPDGEPFPWDEWTIRQYPIADSHPGVYGRLDIDSFRGDLADLRRFALLSYRPSPWTVAGLAGLGLAGAGAFWWYSEQRR